MNLFDLLFVTSFVTLCASLIRLGFLAFRSQRQACRLGIQISSGILAYLASLLAVSLTAPARTYPPGAKQCFDDWCFSIVEAQTQGSLLTVEAKITSAAMRVRQRERNAHVYLVGRDEKAYRPVATLGAPLDTEVAPGEHVRTGFVFEVMPMSKDVALVIRHHATPAFWVIGDPESAFHRPSLMLLPVVGNKAHLPNEHAALHGQKCRSNIFETLQPSAGSALPESGALEEIPAVSTN